MSEIANINDVFSIFHDGGIERYELTGEDLILKISCQYLAERINKKFEYFFVKLCGLEKLTFKPWLENGQNEVWTAPQKIFEFQLEINAAEIKNETSIVTVFHTYGESNFKGGELSIKAKDIELAAQDGTPIPLEALKKLATAYWDHK